MGLLVDFNKFQLYLQNPPVFVRFPCSSYQPSETHENVTVFFSDIVHFTDISRMLTPVKVCDMLDRLYLAFDELAGKHNVFKVETIGDAWMGVTNCRYQLFLKMGVQKLDSTRWMLKTLIAPPLVSLFLKCDSSVIQWKTTRTTLT